jgi:hypothetical protein
MGVHSPGVGEALATVTELGQEAGAGHLATVGSSWSAIQHRRVRTDRRGRAKRDVYRAYASATSAFALQASVERQELEIRRPSIRVWKNWFSCRDRR